MKTGDKVVLVDKSWYNIIKVGEPCLVMQVSDDERVLKVASPQTREKSVFVLAEHFKVIDGN